MRMLLPNAHVDLDAEFIGAIRNRADYSSLMRS